MQQFREISRTRTIYSTETRTSDLIRSEMGSQCSFSRRGGGDGVPRERVLQQNFMTCFFIDISESRMTPRFLAESEKGILWEPRVIESGREAVEGFKEERKEKGKKEKGKKKISSSLVRSKLAYGQEVYFSASNTLLKKLQSIDSKAIQLAIGVPVHTDTLKSYADAGMISLSEQRKLAVLKYVIWSLAVINSVTEDIFIESNKD